MILIVIRYLEVTKMKRTYTKPELDTKGYAQFEDVFTLCSKTSAVDTLGCHPVSGNGNGLAPYLSNTST
jgi:hypothetical protein